MNLAIFDLDLTIIDKDSDHGWNVFLGEKGFIDLSAHMAKNDYFYQCYQNGTLNMEEYLDFNLDFFAKNPPELIDKLLAEFVTSKVKKTIRPKALTKINQHRENGDTILIITATNEIVTTPIAKLLEIENLIATQAEKINGRYSGKGCGVHAFAEGKVIRLNEWLAKQNSKLSDWVSYFYSDSFNDRFLLEEVNYPVAVNPDAKLKALANKNNWEIVDWKL